MARVRWRVVLMLMDSLGDLVRFHISSSLGLTGDIERTLIVPCH
jgi:hypothetical protein